MVQIDIEMPIYCYDCPCHNGENGRCNITGDSTYDKRPFDCPLKEAKRGKWYLRDMTRYGGLPYICTVCGEEANAMHNFCPKCGADMREEKTDG